MKNKYDRLTINKVKKILGCTKDELILLKVYMLYDKEFDNDEDAIQYIIDKEDL